MCVCVSQILKGLSLRVEPGKSLALVGPSGSGTCVCVRVLSTILHEYDMWTICARVCLCVCSDASHVMRLMLVSVCVCVSRQVHCAAVVDSVV